MAEVLLYGSMHSLSAADFINAINEIEDGVLDVRLNTPGGDVMYGYGMMSKFREFEGTKRTKVDGQAYSGGFFFLLFSDNNEAHTMSRSMVHRAAYPQWYEESMSEPIRAELVEVNADLERAFRAKIDVKKFEEIKKVKVKDIFSMDSRIDVFLNAKEMKAIGLIDKIVPLTPTKRAEISGNIVRMAAHHHENNYFVSDIPELPKEEPITTESPITNPINTIMTPEELKAQHPALYAQMVAMGVTQGTDAERDRVGAWSAFTDADPKAVQAGIASGKAITETERSEFTVKIASKGQIAAIEEEGKETPGAKAAVETPLVVDGATELTPEAEFEAKIKEKLNLKSEKN